MFVVGHVSCVGKKERGFGSVHLILKRSKGKEDRHFSFESNDEDYLLMNMTTGTTERGYPALRNIEITMGEIPQETPRMVLLCSEEVNRFTILNAKRQEKYGRREGVGEINLLVVTITIHDDLNSDYGFRKASSSMRDGRDSSLCSFQVRALGGRLGRVLTGAGVRKPKRRSMPRY